MYHVELRQFPHVARAFNLGDTELRQRFLDPWSAGRSIEWGERRWSPDKVRLTIYEAPALEPNEIGMGRGWGNVTRAGRDVSAALLEHAQQASPATATAVSQLKAELLARLKESPLGIDEIPGLVSARHTGWRASEALAVAEQAVWELLHQAPVRLLRGETTLAQQEWQAQLLAWSSWAPDALERVILAGALLHDA